MAAKSSPKDVIETTVSTRLDPALMRAKSKPALVGPPPEIVDILKQDEIDNVVLSRYDLRGISLAGKKLTDCDLGDSLVHDLTNATLSGCNVSGMTAQAPDGKPGGKLDGAAFHSCYSGGEARPLTISESSVNGLAIMGCMFEWIRARGIHNLPGMGMQIGGRSDVSDGDFGDSFVPGFDGSKSKFNRANLEDFRTTDLDPDEIRKMSRAQVEAITDGGYFVNTEFHDGKLCRAVMPKLSTNGLIGGELDLTDAVIPLAIGGFMAVSLIVSRDTCLNYCEFPSLRLLGKRENPFGIPRDVAELEYEIFDPELTPQRLRKGQNEGIRLASRMGLKEKDLIRIASRSTITTADNKQKKKPELDLD